MIGARCKNALNSVQMRQNSFYNGIYNGMYNGMYNGSFLQ